MEDKDETTDSQGDQQQPQDQPEAQQITVRRSRDTTATTNAQPLFQPSDADKLYRLLFGSGGFTPTANMCRLVIEYIAQPEDLSPMQILQKQGHAKQNWYQWQASHPGFLQWWNAVIEDVIRDEHLSGLYLQLLKRARTHDTGAAKLLMQRFDLRYTERSQQDTQHTFGGYEPAAADRSRERQRKALADTVQSPPVVQGDTREGPISPDCTSGNAPGHTPQAEPITGGAPLSPGFTPTIHAQSQHIEHEPGTPTPAGNDKTPVIKPETGIEGAGGDL